MWLSVVCHLSIVGTNNGINCCNNWRLFLNHAIFLRSQNQSFYSLKWIQTTILNTRVYLCKTFSRSGTREKNCKEKRTRELIKVLARSGFIAFCIETEQTNLAPSASAEKKRGKSRLLCAPRGEVCNKKKHTYLVVLGGDGGRGRAVDALQPCALVERVQASEERLQCVPVQERVVLLHGVQVHGKLVVVVHLRVLREAGRPHPPARLGRLDFCQSITKPNTFSTHSLLRIILCVYTQASTHTRTRLNPDNAYWVREWFAKWNGMG